MYRGHKLLEVARHVTCYGESSSSNQSLQIKFDRPSWRKLYKVGQKFPEADLYTISRFHDTLNHKYPSVEAYTEVLEIVLVGDIKPKKKMKEFKFDEVRPKARRLTGVYLYDFGLKPCDDYKKPPPKNMPSKWLKNTLRPI
tara:strand:- start:202 stop:624 length:423 start_codon:yes stop_codon:yes gene_type:complete